MKRINSILFVTLIIVLALIFLLSQLFNFPILQLFGIVFFLIALLGFFTALLQIIYKKAPEKYLISYFIFIIIKFIFIIIYLFIAKQIFHIVTKQYLSFFLITYFLLFSIQIIFISIQLKNLKN